MWTGAKPSSLAMHRPHSFPPFLSHFSHLSLVWVVHVRSLTTFTPALFARTFKLQAS